MSNGLADGEELSQISVFTLGKDEFFSDHVQSGYVIMNDMGGGASLDLECSGRLRT